MDPAHAAALAHLNDLQQQGAFFNMNQAVQDIHNPAQDTDDTTTNSGGRM